MKRILLIFSGIALLLCSCSAFSEYNNSNSSSVTLTAVFEQPSTRTSLSDGGSVVWQSADAISVLSPSANDKFIVSELGTPANSADFKGSLTSASEWYALYPYDEKAYFSGSSIKFKLPQTQQYAAGSFGPGASPAAAVFNSASETVAFKNLCGVLELQLTGNARVSRIALSDNDGALLWGEASVAVSGIGTDSQKMNLTYGSNTIFLDNIDVTLSSVATTFYFVVPQGAFAAGFTAYIYSDSGIFSVIRTDSANVIERSSITAMPVREAVVPAGADLGGNANSFQLFCPGAYSFQATKGCGGAAVTPASVEVLWTTFCNDSDVTDADVVRNVNSNGSTISFEATGKAGNALIAARDASGNIVWSWHIWSLNEPVQVQTYPSGARVQDRNLGALSSEREDGCLSYGLLYQWGRKDPFTGSLVGGVKDSEVKCTGKMETVKCSKTVGTPEYATSHPASFITCTSDWMYSSVNYLWDADNKTAYDPCPEGYCIPPVTAFDGFSASNSTWYSNQGGTDAGTGRVFKFGSMDIWYPATQYRHRSNGSLNGDGDSKQYGYCSSTSGSSSNSYQKMLYFDSGKVNVTTEYKLKGNAQSTRCVRIQLSPSPSVDLPKIAVAHAGSSNAGDIVAALNQCGARAFAIPSYVTTATEAEAIIADVDGIVYAGGEDIHPSRYGEAVNGAKGFNLPRDESDFLLVAAAKKKGIPQMGICRGSQMINAAYGGTLVQDIPTQWTTTLKHSGGSTHSISIYEGSFLHKAMKVTTLSVNSYHHEAVKDLAPGFTVVATAPDGIVEAYEGNNVLAVQFHPELLWQTQSEFLGLFRYFVDMVE